MSRRRLGLVHMPQMWILHYKLLDGSAAIVDRRALVCKATLEELLVHIRIMNDLHSSLTSPSAWCVICSLITLGMESLHLARSRNHSFCVLCSLRVVCNIRHVSRHIEEIV